MNPGVITRYLTTLLESNRAGSIGESCPLPGTSGKNLAGISIGVKSGNGLVTSYWIHQQHCILLISTFLLFYLILVLFVTEGPESFFPTYIDGASSERSTSVCYFKRVMIDILVDIEGLIDIQNVHVINFPVDRRI